MYSISSSGMRHGRSTPVAAAETAPVAVAVAVAVAVLAEVPAEVPAEAGRPLAAAHRHPSRSSELYRGSVFSQSMTPALNASLSSPATMW